jgi:hypothetical protein
MQSQHTQFSESLCGGKQFLVLHQGNYFFVAEGWGQCGTFVYLSYGPVKNARSAEHMCGVQKQ